MYCDAQLIVTRNGSISIASCVHCDFSVLVRGILMGRLLIQPRLPTNDHYHTL